MDKLVDLVKQDKETLSVFLFGSALRNQADEGSDIDICLVMNKPASSFVSGLRLGLPSEENDIFDKIKRVGIISEGMSLTLKEMRGFGNILIHDYAIIDDEVVFKTANTRVGDFQRFKDGILGALDRLK